MTRISFLAAAAALMLAAPASAFAAEPAVEVPAATLVSYAGTYATDRGMDAVVALSLDGGLTIAINSPPFKMRPLSLTEFAVDERKAKVTFNSADGKVTGLTVRMGSRELHASRVK